MQGKPSSVQMTRITSFGRFLKVQSRFKGGLGLQVPHATTLRSTVGCVECRLRSDVVRKASGPVCGAKFGGKGLMPRTVSDLGLRLQSGLRVLCLPSFERVWSPRQATSASMFPELLLVRNSPAPGRFFAIFNFSLLDFAALASVLDPDRPGFQS